MFKEIYNNMFCVWIGKPQNFVVPIPDSDARLVADRLWQMLEWLHNEFIEDAKTNIMLSDDGFQIRNISRTLSYANHVHLLEGILKRMYTNMFIAFKDYGINGISEDTVALSDRRSEIFRIIEFRHTVAAHTAYAYPDEGRYDGLTAANSLHSFLAVGNDGKDMTSFVVNAGEIVSGSKSSKRPIPSIGLRDLHKEMKEHFQSWNTIFVNKLRETHAQLPIETENYRVERPI